MYIILGDHHEETNKFLILNYNVVASSQIHFLLLFLFLYENKKFYKPLFTKSLYAQAGTVMFGM